MIMSIGLKNIKINQPSKYLVSVKRQAVGTVGRSKRRKTHIGTIHLRFIMRYIRAVVRIFDAQISIESQFDGVFRVKI